MQQQLITSSTLDYETEAFREHVESVLYNFSHVATLCISQDQTPARMRYNLMKQLSGMPIVETQSIEQETKQIEQKDDDGQL
jgi:hypothetical protein